MVQIATLHRGQQILHKNTSHCSYEWWRVEDGEVQTRKQPLAVQQVSRRSVKGHEN